MEEDIKYLKKLTTPPLREEWDFAYKLDKRTAQTIENLIKGYREKEKQLDSSRKANELLNKTNNELRLEIRTTYSKVVNDIISKFNLGDEFIPKSKVKEMIEELIKEAEEDGDNWGYCECRIQTLQKLMEG